MFPRPRYFETLKSVFSISATPPAPTADLPTMIVSPASANPDAAPAPASTTSTVPIGLIEKSDPQSATRERNGDDVRVAVAAVVGVEDQEERDRGAGSGRRNEEERRRRHHRPPPELPGPGRIPGGAVERIEPPGHDLGVRDRRVEDRRGLVVDGEVELRGEVPGVADVGARDRRAQLVGRPAPEGVDLTAARAEAADGRGVVDRLVLAGLRRGVDADRRRPGSRSPRTSRS